MSSDEFQEYMIDNSTKLFEKVIKTSRKLRNSVKIMNVVGAKNT